MRVGWNHGSFLNNPHGLGLKKVAQTVNASDDPSAVMMISDDGRGHGHLQLQLQTQPSRKKKSDMHTTRCYQVPAYDDNLPPCSNHTNTTDASAVTVFSWYLRSMPVLLDAIGFYRASIMLGDDGS